MTTLEQIKQKQDELNQMIDEFEANQDTQSEWNPEYNEMYFFVADYGLVNRKFWINKESDLYKLSIGNCFKTREQAEKYKLRLESMESKYLPKEGETYFYIRTSAYTKSLEIDRYRWKNDEFDFNAYLLVRTFRTELEAQDWITNYAKAWEL